MKSLLAYINESSKKESSKGIWFRILVDDSELLSSIKKIADKNKVYCENIDKGIKIEIKPGQEDKLESFIELLTDHANDIQDDSKKEKEYETIIDMIEKMESYLDDIDDEDEKEEE
jgi:hypothetical protein